MKRKKLVFLGVLVTVSILAMTASCTFGEAEAPYGEMRVDAEPSPKTSPAESTIMDMRWDDESSRYIELPRVEVHRKVLILMYHNITTSVTPGEYDRNIQDFENDLIYLRDHNITVISFDDLRNMQQGRVSAPEGDLAIITFNDGFLSHYVYAFPLLKTYGMKATFMLATNLVSHPTFISWTQVRLIANYRNGSGKKLFTIGSQTITHNYLLRDKGNTDIFPTPLDYQRFLNYEIGASRRILMVNAGLPDVAYFSLPYGDGFGDPTIIATAQKYGYKGIRTSEYGTDFGAFDMYTVNNFMWPSLPIFGSTDISSIQHYYDVLTL